MFQLCRFDSLKCIVKIINKFYVLIPQKSGSVNDNAEISVRSAAAHSVLNTRISP